MPTPVQNSINKIGILGGGQLARMLSLAAIPMGFSTLCLDNHENTCAGDVTDVMTSAYDDEQQLQQFAQQVDVVTFETENIPLATAEFIAQFVPIFPSLKSLALTQDRYLEKSMFAELEIGTAPFIAVDSLADLRQAVASLGLPALLKTRRFGYDGKGQYLIKTTADIEPAWKALAGHALILEAFITFDRELSIVAVCGETIDFYPLSENTHHAGILRVSQAPAGTETLTKTAQEYAKRIWQHLDYRGVFAIELFQCGDQLIANEMAPRVHNTGHWTIEGAVTSQFENHIRAITQLPLGSTELIAPSAMVNIIGTKPAREKVLAIPKTHFHDYHKAPRPQRKLGHMTLTTTDTNEYQRLLPKLTALCRDN